VTAASINVEAVVLGLDGDFNQRDEAVMGIALDCTLARKS